jgi:hypothetical protein
MTYYELLSDLHAKDEGILRAGSHPPGVEMCALEFESQVRGREWSDAPLTLPDLCQLNDAVWSSDAARTEAMLRVMAALWDWGEWSSVHQRAWTTRIVIQTVQQIVSALPRLSERVREECRTAVTLSRPAWAAWAAAEAAWAAWAAAEAAEAKTAADRVLLLACQIWIDAATEAA